MTILVQVLGWLGVFLYTFAYYQVSIGRLEGRSKKYQLLNLAGAFGVAVNAIYYGPYPSATVNGIWFVIASATLGGILISNDDRDPAHPESHMSRLLNRFLFFFSCLLVVFGFALLVLAISPKPPKPMKPAIVYTADWQPFTRESRSDRGVMSHTIRKLFRAINYEAEFRFTEAWSQAIEKVESGAGVAAFPLIPDEERRDQFLFSEPIIEFDYVLFYRRGLAGNRGKTDDEAIRDWIKGQAADKVADKKQYRVGVVKGSLLWPALRSATAPQSPKTYANSEMAFQGLLDGEIDLLAEGRLAGLWTLRSEEASLLASQIAFTRVDDPIARSREPLYLLFRNSDHGNALKQKLDQQIRKMRDAGEFEQLKLKLERLIQTKVEVRTEAKATLAHPRGQENTDFFLPPGTEGYVLRWAVGYGQPVNSAPHQDRCLVKITNGPLKGWEFLIDPGYLAIIESKANQ